ncbi:uncharacterized protein LOC125725078 [Brienomyrus brachyistius]|uniref:uncharacterized protein LOC125725078 n=1 Tax=Brienomyrus brachyistius TaxID=42636 RepID=UPI0020B1BA5B|nr:uncharacterized protein LOC125725078 [Brienomyrus brachyistius]
MLHRRTKAIAAGRRDNNRFLCTIVRYGPAVGVVIFSLLSLWAVIAIYRTMTGEKKNKKYASERKEISTERHAPCNSKLTENSVDCAKDCRENAWLPGEQQNLCARSTTTDELHQCFESGLGKEQEEHPAQLHATGQAETPPAHSDVSSCITPKYCMGGQHERSCSGNDHYHNDRPDLPAKLTGGYHGSTGTDSTIDETEMNIGILASGCDIQVQDNPRFPVVLDTEVHGGYPNSHHCLEQECLSIHINDDSGAGNMTSDKNEDLETESNVMGRICDKNVTEGTLDSSQRFATISTGVGEHEHEGLVDILDTKCTFPERYVEEQADADLAVSALKESSCQSSLDGDPMGKRVVVVPPMPQMVAIHFGVHYITRSPSQQLAITGSIPELGDWTSFVPLCQSPNGLWVDTVALPADRQVEWKFVLVEDGKIQRWEECANRHLVTGSDRDILLHKAWGII